LLFKFYVLLFEVKMSVSTKEKIIFATGRRKTARARVRLIPNGTGKYTVNGKPIKTYCFHESMMKKALLPFKIVEAVDKFDVCIRVDGSGLMSQSGAISHGLARALEKYNPEWRILLKRAGQLKRDPRQKERKKSGRPGARKRFQFSKR
jgi:small subunit ribosomal protein S9